MNIVHHPPRGLEPFKFEVIKYNISVTMDKKELRAVIKYLYLKKLKPKEIHQDIITTLGEDSVSYSTIKKWSSEFKKGRNSIEDDPRCGRPRFSSSNEMVQNILKIIMNDRRICIRRIADILKIGKSVVSEVITNEMGMNKVCARWVPKNLSPEQKLNRLRTSKENLGLFQQNKELFIQKFITMDETWVHHFDPETKLQSKQWKFPWEPTPKKFKAQASAGKVMASIFWDSEGVIMIDYLGKGTTITGEYYTSLINKLREKIKEKRRGKLTKGILYHQDNAPAHTSRLALNAIHEAGFELMEHPPYSPDLAPSDYYLFPIMKNYLKGRHFVSDDDIKAEVNNFLEDQDKDFFRKGIEALEKRWMKCIDLQGSYVEK